MQPLIRRECECGRECRGPLHGYCGGCGGFIAHEDPERDQRWLDTMEELRRKWPTPTTIEHFIPCRRCGALDHCACFHDACCYCGSKEHHGLPEEHIITEC